MIHGTILLDKPKNITSNKALSIIKKELSLRKAGVVGILDPLASGMLPIVVNQATKLAKFVESYEKEYLVTSQLGFTSTTGDEEGIISSLKKTNVKESKKKAFIMLNLVMKLLVDLNIIKKTNYTQKNPNFTIKMT